MLLLAALAALQAAPTADYLEAIERYRQGDRTVLRRPWSEERLRSELAGIKRLVRISADCAECDERSRVQAFPFEAAAMLLTARDIAERDALSEGEQAASRPAPLLDVARQTIELIPDAERRRRFERPWFLAAGMHLYQRGQWPLAQEYMDLGLRLYPSDGELLLLRASILETLSAAAAESPSPEDMNRFTARTWNEQVAQQVQVRGRLLAQAEDYYRRALAADPSLDEGRARLGRVLAQRGKREQASAELKAVIAAPGAPMRARYLAQLFLGALRESEGKLREAQAAYEAAIVLEPRGQAGYVALSHARHRAGKWARSRSRRSARPSVWPARDRIGTRGGPTPGDNRTTSRSCSRPCIARPSGEGR
ncbi:MAG TPA: hypothetical protein VFM88_08705 [Vicinamibacteria bacterium]|nr:hypothetical protein [Vicinamibacteria bacterium]